MKYSLLILLLYTVRAIASGPESLPLLSGDTLQRWRVPQDNQWWTVEQGVLVAQSDPQQTGSILWTQDEFEDFVLELEFRYGPGTVDSGVFVRCEREQIQIGQSGSLKRDLTGSPYIVGKGYPAEAVGVAATDLLKPDDWNRMTLRAVGNVYTVTLNGKQVLEYPSLTAVEKGPIGLQLHPGREMRIEFRRIKVREPEL